MVDLRRFARMGLGSADGITPFEPALVKNSLDEPEQIGKQRRQSGDRIVHVLKRIREHVNER